MAKVNAKPTTMRSFLLLLVCLAAGGYYYYNEHPAESARLVADLPAESAKIVTNLPALLKGETARPEARVKPWVPPTVLPAHPNWTWTTSDGTTYRNVKVVKVEADAVTILHDDGGGRVPLATLPPDLQAAFHYDPAAAAVAAQAFQKEEADAAQVEAQERGAAAPPFDSSLSNYADAVQQAKSNKKLVLLHFTGSDWCPYCQYLDREVLNASSFQKFSASNFIFVTLDFPRNTQLPAELAAQNQSLARKYGVNGYPTLVITDTEGKELGRATGYAPGSGPDEVIAHLKPFAPH